MRPVVDRLAEEYGDRIEFRLLNVGTDQAASELAGSLGVQYVPTFVFVNGEGVISKQVVGAQSEAQMRAMLDVLQ